MARAKTALYKPSTNSVLLNKRYNSTVIARDANGNIVGQSNRGTTGHERYSKDGSGYGKYVIPGLGRASTLEIDGKVYNFRAGQKTDFDLEDDGGDSTSDDGNFGSAPNAFTSPGGNTGFYPAAADFAGLEAPYVDYQQSLDRARAEGQFNKNAFYDNVAGSKDQALGLIDTDVEGVIRSANALSPYVREQGNLDTQTNTSRAGAIDAFNFSRLPAFNNFNQGQWDASVDASGLDTRNRFQKVAGQLDTETTGNLSDDFLNGLLSDSVQNEGSDLVSASGMGNISGAGIRAKDRLQIKERMAIKDRAQQLLPNVLAQGQQILSAPTTLAKPTDVPLNTSNVADRLPVMSAMSAGNAQLQLGTQATDYETIPASQVLNTSLQTETFNEEGQFRRDTYVLDAEQGFNTSQANAYQGAFDADKSDVRYQSQQDAYDKGLEAQKDAQDNQAIAGAIGTAINAYGNYQSTQGSGTNSSGTGTVPGAAGGGINPGGGSSSTQSAPIITTNGPVRTGSNTFGQSTAGAFDSDGDGNISFGGYSVPTDSFGGFIDAANVFSQSYPQAGSTSQSNPVGSASGSGLPQANYDDGAPITVGQFNQDLADINSGIDVPETQTLPASGTLNIDGVTVNSNAPDQMSDVIGGLDNKFTSASQRSTLPSSIKPLVYNPKSKQTDTINVARGSDIAANWKNYSDTRKYGSGAELGINALTNSGVINEKDGALYQRSAANLTTVVDPNSTSLQKSSALAALYNDHRGQTFTGNINAPQTINGQKVVAKNGDTFVLQDGSKVDRATLLNGVRTTNGLNAIGVLTSGADNKTKLQAITALGIDQAAAEKILTDYQAGSGLSALAVFNTADNWNKMSDLQRVGAISSTSARVLDTYGKYTNPGTQGGGVAGGVGALTTVAALSTWKDANDAQRVQISAQTGQYGASQLKSFAATGADTGTSTTLGTVGTIFGAAAAVAGVYLGVKQAADVISAVDDMPKSQAVKAGTVGLGAAGASIGAGIGVGIATYSAVTAGSAAAAGATAGATAGSVVPVVGTVIGLVIGAAIGVAIGSTGTKKGSGQLMRDGYRKGLKDAKVINKNKDTGSYEVELADGSTYDIGKDGGHKLKNLDGTERHTFDVDWGNKAAADMIPDAHLLAMASGVGPDADKFDLFHRTTAQWVNATTSNTKDPAQARANMKVQFDKLGVDPRSIALQVETYRNQDIISEQAYNVYLQRVNQMFGTKLLPSKKEDSRNRMIEKLKGSTDKKEQEFLKRFTDPKVLQENAKRYLGGNPNASDPSTSTPVGVKQVRPDGTEFSIEADGSTKEYGSPGRRPKGGFTRRR